MITIARNGSNDLYVSGGKLAMASGADCQCEIIESIICTQQGELQFDEGRGVDYFGTAFRSARYLNLWAAQVRKIVSELPWVRSIEDFQYDFDRESGTVTWSMTVLNDDDERLDLQSRRKNEVKTEFSSRARWEDVIDKPKGLDETLKFTERAVASMAGESELTEESALKDVKRVVNKALLIPGGARDFNDDDDIRLTVKVENDGDVLFGVNKIEVSPRSSWLVDYDDGSVVSLKQSDTVVPEHSYANPGRYVVSINGVFDRIGVRPVDGDLLSAGPHSVDWKFCVTSVTLGKDLALGVIGDGMFSGCASLSDFSAQNSGVTSIGASAFANCTSLSSLKGLPAGLTEIGVGCFRGCTSLKNLDGFPKGLAAVPSECFRACIGLVALSGIGSAVREIGESAFAGCTGLRTTSGLGSSVTKIGDSAFSECTSMTVLNLTDGIESIGSSVVDGCVSLARIETFSRVPPTAIDDSFSGIPSSVSLYVPYDSYESYLSAAGWRGVDDIRKFEKISFLLKGVTTNFRIDGGTGVFNSSTGWRLSFGDGTAPFFGPEGRGFVVDHLYETAGDYTIMIEGVITGMSSGQASGLGSDAYPFITSKRGKDTSVLKEVTFTENASLTYIGDMCFALSRGLERIVGLPDGCRSVGRQAFYGCLSLESFEADNTVIKSLGEECFKGCTSMSLVSFPNGMDEIKASCFERCSSITGLGWIPPSVTKLGDGAFRDCSSLESLVGIPVSVTEIGDDCFFGCSALESLVGLPDAITKIGRYVFSECSGLLSLEGLNENITTFGEGCFRGCNALTEVELSGAVVYIASGAFTSPLITSVTCRAVVPPIVGNLPFAKSEGVTLRVGKSFANAYAANAYWKSFDIVGMGVSFYVRDLGEGDAVAGGLSHVTSTSGVLIDWGDGETTDLEAGEQGIPAHAYAESADNVVITLNGDVTKIEGGEDCPVICFQVATMNAFVNRVEVGARTGVVEIGQQAFAGYGSEAMPLEVFLNDTTIATIGDYAFSGCVLGRLVLAPLTPPAVTDATFDGVDKSKVLISVPAASISDYMTADVWDEFDYSQGMFVVFTVDVFAGERTFPEGTIKCLQKWRVCYDWTEGSDENVFTDYIEPDVMTIPPHTYSESKTVKIAVNGLVSEINGRHVIDEYDRVVEVANAVCKTGPDHPYDVSPLGSLLECEVFGNPPILTLGGYAFYGSKITNIAWMPDSVESIGVSCFSNCGRLTSFSGISSGLLSLSERCFFNCARLESLDGFPKGVSEIPKLCFAETSSLSSLKGLKDANVVTIGESAFESSGIESLDGMPGTVTEIGYGAFWSCHSLSSLQGFSQSVESIPAYCFSSCDALLSLIGLPDGLVSIGANAFSYTGITSLEGLPDSVATIGDSAFEDSHVSSLVGLEGVEEIGDRCFAFTRLTGEVLIPSSVTSVGDMCFAECPEISSARIEASGVSLGGGIFEGCGGVSPIVLSAAVPSVVKSEWTLGPSRDWIPPTFFGLAVLETEIQLFGDAEAERAAYESSAWAPYFYDTSRYVEVSIPYYSSGQDYSLAAFSKFALAAGETSCLVDYGSGEYAILPSTAQTIPGRVIPHSVAVDGHVTIRIFGRLKSISTGDSDCYPFCCLYDAEIEAYYRPGDEAWYVRFVGQDAFETLGQYACKQTTWNAMPTLPRNTSVIDFEAFEGCMSVPNLSTLPNLREISSRAFANALKGDMSDMVISSDNITAIEARAFIVDSDKRGTDVYGPRTLSVESSALESVDAYAFSGRNGLESVSFLGDALARIEDYAFEGCTALSEISLAAPVPPDCTALSFEGVTLAAIVLKVPAESVSAYQNHAVFGQMTVEGV